MIKELESKLLLKNKTVFIIGGCGLIGFETTLLFLKAQAKVVVLDISNQKLVENKKSLNKFKSKIFYEFFDCTKEEFLEKKYYEILKKYKCPNILINCSYPFTKQWSKSNFKSISKSNLDENIKIHLNSYCWLARVTAEKMKLNKINGSIILFGSIYGILGQDLNIYENTSMKENMTYSIIKGGIINFTRQMASYYGKHVRVNSISPGGLRGHVQGKSKNQEKKFIINYSRKVPINRLGNSIEIAYSTLFLASDAASYINGHNLIVDGGWSII
jgi:NAD(P)-dependent dehydrogenase (short-subunit alcohol dehydrogenase family)|tara:strand:+ start:2716 stop:3534 length:819 start_codon:yes stop_codon:yes gene_type:complete